jgi:hypothetical protein
VERNTGGSSRHLNVFSAPRYFSGPIRCEAALVSFTDVGSTSSEKPRSGTTEIPVRRAGRTILKNVIVLGDEFYNEILAHPIPTDVDAVKALVSAVLDLFMWLVYRCFVAKREERIPLFGHFGLTAQLGSIEYTRPRRFKAIIQQWLSTIRTVWPGCPAKMCSDGQHLSAGPGKAILQRTDIRDNSRGGFHVSA